MKKIVMTVVVFVFFSCSSAFANSYIMADIFKTSLGGAAVGAVAGLSAAGLSDDFSDHSDYIGKGAALGALVGMCYAIFNASQTYNPPLALIEKDKEFKFGFPQVKILPKNGVEASLFSMKF